MKDVLRPCYLNVHSNQHTSEWITSKAGLYASSKTTSKPLVEKYWSVENPNDTVCRVYDPCLRRDGRVLISKHLKNRTTECHLRNVEFTDFDSISNQRLHSTSHLTLLGAYEMQRHIPHFLTDILPAIFATELIWSLFPHESKRLLCLTSTSAIPDCYAGRSQFLETESLAIRVHDSVLKFKKSHWIPSVISMLRGRPWMFSTESIFPKHDKRNLHCFDSIILFGNARYKLENKEWFAGKNAFFWKNKLVRSGQSRFEELERNEMDKLKNESHKIRIVVVDRLPSSKRHISNIHDVVSLIKSIGMTRTIPNIALVVTVVHFENMTFTEQVNSMQSADIIIGTHGAGLSNIIFAKVGTPLIEIYPFMYYAGPFYAVAKAFSLNYRSVVAYPDTTAYMGCITSFQKEGNINESIANSAKRIWENGLERRRRYGEETEGVPRWPLPEGFYLRFCVREQQLHVNISHIKEYIYQGIQHAAHTV